MFKKIDKKFFIIVTSVLFLILWFSPSSNAQLPWPPLPVLAPLPYLAPVTTQPALTLAAEAVTFFAPSAATTIPAAYIWLSIAAPPTKVSNLPVPTTIYIVPSPTLVSIAPPGTTVAAPSTTTTLTPSTTIGGPAITPAPAAPATTLAPATISALGLVQFPNVSQPALPFGGFNPFFNPLIPFGILF